jgi:tetraacyldisaccharide 4'-kinase
VKASQANREARWQGMAMRRGLGARLLWTLSVAYGWLMDLRRRLYRLGWLASHKMPVPVLVVGNVVVGGAGKTPTAIVLVNHLKLRGWHPGVVSRGHGRSATGAMEVDFDTAAQASGDEPALIRRATQVPVFVSARRVDAARALLAAHPKTDVLVCDDGLQHLALQRDLDIVVFDDRGMGNGWLLPAGLLREPWPPGKFAHSTPMLVLRQFRQGQRPTPVPVPDLVRVFDAGRTLADHAINHSGQRVPLDALKGTPLVAVAGLARPDVFFAMLSARGLNLIRQVALPDHARSDEYLPWLADGQAAVICTEKDAVKLSGIDLPPGACVWSVALELEPDPAFFAAIDDHLQGLKAQG